MKLLLIFWGVLVLLPAHLSYAKEYQFGAYNRVIQDRSKLRIECPSPSKNVGVLFFAGQSNAGNHAEKLISSSEVPDVVMYFHGKCFKASSPVLGGSRARGEFNSLIAQSLVEKGLFDTVVITNLSVGSSKIDLWSSGALLDLLLEEVSDIEKIYDINLFIWIHGESDNRVNTDPSFYVDQLLNIYEELKIFGNFELGLTLNTHCKKYAVGRNKVDLAHNELIKRDDIIELGNLDVLGNFYRRDDCHFNEAGQKSASDIISTSIFNYFLK